MIEISKCMVQGGGLAAALLKRSVQVALDWDTRQKSRFDFHGPDGTHYGVFLPRGTVVRGGDVLVAADGSLITVTAAAQPVVRITCDPVRGSAFDLVRAAYHLGNRHVPIELRPDHLKIEPDHVLAEMVQAMGLVAHNAMEGFEPESGAYTQGAGHHHGPNPEHGHEHGHGHSAHQTLATPPATTGHVHGPSCNHDHDHAPVAPAKPVPIAVVAATGHVHGPHCKHGHDHS